MTKKVAIQGGDASFHDIATRSYFDQPVELICCDTFRAVFDAVHRREADTAVVAIENSLYGSINEVYDQLLSSQLQITGEVYLRIKQCLIGLPGTKIANIKEIHSHPVALAQCQDYLDNQLPHAERFEHVDTALSVRDIAHWQDTHKAAIASPEAAQLHGMEVLAEEIETNKQNYTRFVVLEQSQALPAAWDKASFILTTQGDLRPGSLHRALGVLKDYDLNMTLLHSRPILGKAWHYMFYIDVIDSASASRLDQAIAQLESNGCSVRMLGRYQAGKTL